MLARPGGEAGSTLVEFGIAAIVLLMLVVGIIYGGIMAYDRVVLSNAVAIGARTMAAEQGDATACTDASNAINGPNNYAYGLNRSAITVTQYPVFTSKTGSGAGTSSCDVTTGTSPINGANCTTTSPCQELNGGELVTMAASYPCNMYFPHLGINLCPMASTSLEVTNPNSGVSITVSCPTTYCVYSIATALIEY